MNKVNKIISDRRSTVTFSDSPVEEESMDLLFEAARWAPSSFNEQPWRFIYGNKGTETYDKILECLFPANQVWAGKAPVLVLTILSKFHQRNGAPNKYAWYDLGQAVGNISAQATDMGLKMHQMGGFDPLKAKEEFGIDDNFEPATVIAIGYAGSIDDLDENLRQREMAERSRKPVKEIVFRESLMDRSTIV